MGKEKLFGFYLLVVYGIDIKKEPLVQQSTDTHVFNHPRIGDLAPSGNLFLSQTKRSDHHTPHGKAPSGHGPRTRTR